MEYSLAIKNENQSYKIQNYYIRNENFEYEEGLSENSLKDITNFTQTFANEESLMEYLLETGAVDPELHNWDIVLLFYKGQQNKPVLKDMAYEDSKKYFSQEGIANYICAKLVDKEFWAKFKRKYINRLKNVEHFRESVSAIENVMAMYDDKYGTERYIPMNHYDIIFDFVDKYTTKKIKDNLVEIDYTRLREMALFIDSYEKSKKEQPYNRFKDERYLTTLQATLAYYENILMLDSNLDEEQKESYNLKIDEIKDELRLFGVNKKDAYKLERK